MAAGSERSQLQRAARTTFGRLPRGAEPRRARPSGAPVSLGCHRGAAGMVPGTAGMVPGAEGRMPGAEGARLPGSAAATSQVRRPKHRRQHRPLASHRHDLHGRTKCCFLPLCPPSAPQQEAQAAPADGAVNQAHGICWPGCCYYQGCGSDPDCIKKQHLLKNRLLPVSAGIFRLWGKPTFFTFFTFSHLSWPGSSARHKSTSLEFDVVVFL